MTDQNRKLAQKLHLWEEWQPSKGEDIDVSKYYLQKWQ